MRLTNRPPTHLIPACNVRLDPQPPAAALREVARQCDVQLVIFARSPMGYRLQG